MRHWRKGDSEFINAGIQHLPEPEAAAAVEAAYRLAREWEALRDIAAVAGDLWNELEELREHWEDTPRGVLVQGYIDQYEAASSALAVLQLDVPELLRLTAEYLRGEPGFKPNPADLDKAAALFEAIDVRCDNLEEMLATYAPGVES
jgi:hypothetical protein